MRSKLFRSEALKAKESFRLDDIYIRAPRIGWAALACAVVVLISIAAIIYFGRYNRYARVTGRLLPDTGLITVEPPITGIVTSVLVHQGDTVRKGQSLISVAKINHTSRLGDTQEILNTQMGIQRSKLKDDLSIETIMYDIDRKSIEKKISILKRKKIEIDNQISLQKKREHNAYLLDDKYRESADKGIVSKVESLQQHDQAIQSTVDLNSLIQKSLDIKQEIQQEQASLDELPQKTASARNSTERKIADIQQQLALRNEKDSATIHAAIAGIVTNVLVHPGQTVLAERPLLTMQPKNSRLTAELWVPSSEIGFIRKNAPVWLHYDAYPYKEYGSYRGRVVQISQSAVPADVLTNILGEAVKQPRYRVAVALDTQAVRAGGVKHRLKSGMTLHAEIFLHTRLIRDWIMSPLHDFERNNIETSSTGADHEH